MRSDCAAEACSRSDEGQGDLPALTADGSYAQFAAVCGHAVLLRSACAAEACGRSCEGQRDLPALLADRIYAQLLLGGRGLAALPRAAGTSEASDRSYEGECVLPGLIAVVPCRQLPLDAAMQPCRGATVPLRPAAAAATVSATSLR